MRWVRPDPAPRAGDKLLGSVYLLADDTGTMCVVTLKTIELGEETPASAYLEPENGNRAIQDGDYEFLRGAPGGKRPRVRASGGVGR